MNIVKNENDKIILGIKIFLPEKLENIVARGKETVN